MAIAYSLELSHWGEKGGWCTKSMCFLGCSGCSGGNAVPQEAGKAEAKVPQPCAVAWGVAKGTALKAGLLELSSDSTYWLGNVHKFSNPSQFPFPHCKIEKRRNTYCTGLL